MEPLITILETKPFLKEISPGVWEEAWTIKDGTHIIFSKVTHQHWSNIYWFHRYIKENHNLRFVKDYKSVFPDDTYIEKYLQEINFFMETAEKQINLRFNGEILEWAPIYDNEKKWYKKQNTRYVLIEKFKE